jgi:hypothetical protein
VDRGLGQKQTRTRLPSYSSVASFAPDHLEK